MARICVDPGHGGKDPGAVNLRNRYLPEKTINLKVAQELAYQLGLHGHVVELTRDRDVFISLQERCNISNRFRADIFISIHCNAAEASAASGIEIIHAVNSYKGRKLSGYVLREMSREFPEMKNRGLKASKSTIYPRWIRVVHKTNAPAALVELGFISNTKEGATLNTPSNWKRFAKSIAAGVEDYLL